MSEQLHMRTLGTQAIVRNKQFKSSKIFKIVTFYNTNIHRSYLIFFNAICLEKELDIELNSYLSKAQKDQAPINKLKALIAP